MRTHSLVPCFHDEFNFKTHGGNRGSLLRSTFNYFPLLYHGYRNQPLFGSKGSCKEQPDDGKKDPTLSDPADDAAGDGDLYKLNKIPSRDHCIS